MRFFQFDTVVIGSGCAAYNAADSLYDFGHTNIAIVTEGKNVGTSRNTGSDKQTYYKLSLCSSAPDSVREMAGTLYCGGCVDGDIALAEAAGSVRGFMKLVGLGVPFPTNRYGEYVGYKTDHDPRQRATSVGPLTSRYMTEALEKRVFEKKIPFFDGLYVVKILVQDGRAVGLIACTKEGDTVVFCCGNVVLATGGPAGVYADSVYPACHTGSSGLAVRAGAVMCNLQEWQYGIASTAFRWNVSGTYQQVIPRYFSLDDTGEEHEFLNDYYKDPVSACYDVFLKGYQWPFDSAKADGSSRVDLAVYEEIKKGRRVFMDFTRDPTGLDLKTLPQEAYSYLENSGALLATPINRLLKMNEKAAALYLEHGIDLTRQPLEIGMCAQHCNGGVRVDDHWQSSVRGLFAAGEAAGTFGVYRPGGAALNSTQVGSLRAAQQIAFFQPRHALPPRSYYEEEAAAWEQSVFRARGKKSNFAEIRERIQKKMSSCAAFVRTLPEMRAFLRELYGLYENFGARVHFSKKTEMIEFLKTEDIVLAQIAILESMIRSAETAGSRGSCIVREGDKLIKEDLRYREKILCAEKRGDRVQTRYENRRPIPPEDDWFEKVWNEFNEKNKSRGNDHERN